MKKTFITILTILLIVIPQNTYSQTNVNGFISSDETWSLLNSPYIVTGNIMVNEGVTLTIEPGVIIKFETEKILQINGALFAQGTNDNKITFTSNQLNPTEGDWGYINFTDLSIDATFDGIGVYISGSILKYCIIEYGGSSGEGVIVMTTAHPYITYCNIQNNSSWAIDAIINGTLFIKNLLVENNQGGIDIDLMGNTGNAYIDNCVIKNNFDTGIATSASTEITNNQIISNTCNPGRYYRGAGIHLSGGINLVKNNFIKNNYSSDTGGGIHVISCTATISDNIIFDNTASSRGGGAISAWHSNSLTIEKNFFIKNKSFANGGAINLKSDVNPVIIINNVFAENSSENYGGAIYEECGHGCSIPIIEYNTIYKNSASNFGALYYKGEETGLSFSYNTFTCNISTDNESKTIYIGSLPIINYNNIYGNSATYELLNDNNSSTPFLNAENNWWGTSIDLEIQALIYDWMENGNLGIVDYDPCLVALNITAPISPPTNVAKLTSGNGVKIYWSANLESDVTGYMIHYGNPTGYSYTSNIDVGNVNTYTISSGINISDEISVTAYDSNADGNDDQVDGHMSWFAVANIPPDPPVADFIADNTKGPSPFTVNFTDLSVPGAPEYPINSWSWDFDGDEIIDSNVQNPSFTFIVPGSYTVSLTISDGRFEDTETKENYILSIGPILFENPEFSASVFYNNISYPDGIAILPDESLLVVNEWSRPDDPGIGVYHAVEGDEFDITDAFSTIGSPFISPDDIARYPDARIFVVDGQARTVFKISASGGLPEVFVTPESTGSPNFNPYGLAIAPENFDGPNVNPGDLIITDNGFGSNDKAVWSVNPNTGADNIIAQGSVFIDGPLNLAFTSGGTLFIFQNNDSGSGRIVILSPDGIVTPFLSGIESRAALAIHPITNELYFKNREGEIFRIPESGGTPELFASNIHGYQDLVFNTEGNKLFMSATTRRQVICITGPFYCSPPLNLHRRNIITSGEIYLEWDVPVDCLPDSYKIYRDNIQIGETGGSNTSFSDSEVVHGTEYEYYVTAYYESDPIGESPASNTISLFSIKSVDYLSINNIKSLVYSDGACFNNTDGSSSGFEFPINSEKTLHYFGNIWLGGEYGGELYLAANKYGHFPSVNSFTPGPVADLYDQDFFNDWNQVWKVSKADVDYHKQNFMDVGYQIQYNILNWPAHGDPTKGMAADLAPYIDTDNNGIYEPSMGDYPEIKGDEAIYFIFNDSNVAPNLTGRELKFEYHGMMYAYATVNDMTLSNTIFIQYRIFNRSDLDFDEMKLGYYSDFDLGYAWDDYVGCDEALNSYYAYNDPFDGNGEVYAYGDNPPAIGTVFLSDNMETFITYSNNSGVTGDPSTSSDYWNYLNATWKDGEHIRYGGNGHPSNGSSGDPTNYMYPGNLNNMTEWSELSVGNAPGDRRGLGVISFPLAAGDSYELDIGFVAARDIDGNNITSVDHLKEKIVDLQNKYNMDLLNWSVNPADFEYDGEIIAEVLIDDAPVSYTGGTLGAFVGDQSRGVYKTSRTGPAGKVVFILRCYSNLENGETLSFRYYDPILDITFNINETIDFESDMTVGNAREPVQLHAYTTIDISIPLSQGWTWFSLNVYNENMNIDEVLSSLTLSENDYIKSQRFSSTYYEAYNWFGNLEEFNNRDMYKILLNQSDILEYTGYAVDPTEVPIEISTGWTWVAYTPQYNLPLSDALTSLNLQELDYIKNQRFSSTYYEGYGWFGTLEELFPNDGYMIKSAEPGTLVYPPQIESAPQILIEKINKSYISFFDFNPSLYRFNGSLTAEVLIDENNSGSTENILFAFTGNKCRGQTKGLIFPPTGEYIYNLMIYSNIESGEEITFRFYNSKEDQWYEFEEKLNFESDMIEANAFDPFELKNGSIMNTDWMTVNGFSYDVYPNPFNGLLNINFDNPKNQRVNISIFDGYGRKIRILKDRSYPQGNQNLNWDGQDLPNGIYYFRIQTEEFVMNQKLVKVD